MEEYIGINLYILELGNVFWDMISRADATKEKYVNLTSS